MEQLRLLCRKEERVALKFLSGYVWPEEKENKVSLMLHQIRTKSGGLLFACVCGDCAEAGNYATGRLTEWFYRDGALCGGWKWERTESALRDVTEQILGEWRMYSRRSGKTPDYPLTAVLAAGRRFWLLQQGDGGSGCFVVNNRFGRPYIRALTESGYRPWENRRTGSESFAEESGAAHICVQSGIIQRGVGILLAAGSFGRGIGKEEVEQCLAAEAMTDDGQIGRRLRELWRFGEGFGGDGRNEAQRDKKSELPVKNSGGAVYFRLA